MKEKLIIKTEQEMIRLGEIIGRQAEPNMLFVLTGDLGAGKTTLTKGIGLGLDISDIINSPTFTIMKIYDGRLRLYHLDTYRLDGAGDDIELEEYFYEGGVTVIEWGLNISEILPDEYMHLEINLTADGSREIILMSNSDKYNNFIRGIYNEYINY